MHYRTEIDRKRYIYNSIILEDYSFFVYKNFKSFYNIFPEHYRPIIPSSAPPTVLSYVAGIGTSRSSLILRVPEYGEKLA